MTQEGAKAHGLNLMTMNIGADHNSGYGIQEIFGTPYKGKVVDRFAIEDKGEMTKWNQDISTVWGHRNFYAALPVSCL